MISDELELASMFIGYFVPADPWSCPFRQLGLELRAVQRPFSVSFRGQLRQVQPEVVLAKEAVEYSVALEVKSRMVNRDQVGRYAMLDGQVIRRDLAFAPLANSQRDVIFFTESANKAALKRNIESALSYHQLQINGHGTFPIVERDDSRVVLHAGSLSHADLQITFTLGIEADSTLSAPSHFIRFTADSPIYLLLPDVLNLVHQNIVRQSTFTTRDVCVGIVSYWDVRGTEEKAAFINKGHAILSKLVREDYKSFFSLGNLRKSDSMGCECKRW